MNVSRETIEKLKQLHAGLDLAGREINDPNPVFIPALNRPLSLQDQIKRVLRTELSQQASAQGFETFEDADDFEVDDDFDAEPGPTPYVVMEHEIPKPVKKKPQKVEKKVIAESAPPSQTTKPPESPVNSGGSTPKA